MAIGNAVLFLIVVPGFRSGRHFSGLDIASWLVVILIVTARSVDLRHFAGKDEFWNVVYCGRRKALRNQGSVIRRRRVAGGASDFTHLLMSFALQVGDRCERAVRAAS